MELFEERADGITLRGMECAACGHSAFPFQHYGCEKCGAFGDSLSEKGMAAKGRLLSYAMVNLHMGKDIKPPFLVGLIQLEDGPTIRCTLVERNASELEHGAMMVGRIIHNTQLDPDNPVDEVRFTKEHL